MASASWSWKRWLSFKSWYCLKQNKETKERNKTRNILKMKSFFICENLGARWTCQVLLFLGPLGCSNLRSLRHFFFAPCYSPLLIHNQAVLYKLCPIRWITILLSSHEVLKAEVPLGMWGEMDICHTETQDKGCHGGHAHQAPLSLFTQYSSFYGDLEELTGKNTNVDIMLAKFNTLWGKKMANVYWFTALGLY